MGVFLIMLAVLVVIGAAIGTFANKGKRVANLPNETERDRYVRLCNASLEAFDKTNDLATKFREHALLEKNLEALLRISPDSHGARQLKQMMPEMRRRLMAASNDSAPNNAAPHDYGIDMTQVQEQVRNAEKSLFNTAYKNAASNSDPWLAHCIEIEDAWHRGDYDFARAQLQRIAYTMVGGSVTVNEKNRFTQLMADFAKDDPLYNEVMERLMPLVQANPGLVQSQLYKGEPDHIKEQMRYVLYFANELGHIQRVKKGNSYKLYPANADKLNS